MSQTVFPMGGGHQRTPSNQTPIQSRHVSMPSTPTAGGSPARGSGVWGPVPIQMPSIRERVFAFYKKYNAAKLSDVENILKMYTGKDVELMTALQAKYGPEEMWWIPKQNPQQPQRGAGAVAAAPPLVQVLPEQQRQSAGGAPGVVPSTPPVSSSLQGASSFQQRLHALLSRHEPAKLHLIPQMVVAFKGNEENLIRGLERKYLTNGVSSAAPSGVSTPLTPHPSGKGFVAALPSAAQQPLSIQLPQQQQQRPQLFPGQTSPTVPKAMQLFPGQSSPLKPNPQVVFTTQGSQPVPAVVAVLPVAGRPPLVAAVGGGAQVTATNAQRQRTKRRDLRLDPKLAELAVSDSDDSDASGDDHRSPPPVSESAPPIKPENVTNAASPPAATSGKKRPLTPTVVMQSASPKVSAFVKPTLQPVASSPTALKVPPLIIASQSAPASPLRAQPQAGAVQISPQHVLTKNTLHHVAPQVAQPNPPPPALVSHFEEDPQVSPRTDLSADSRAPSLYQQSKASTSPPQQAVHSNPQQRTEPPQWAGNAIEPITDRRSNDRAIVVAPVLVIGSRSSTPVAVQPHHQHHQHASSANVSRNHSSVGSPLKKSTGISRSASGGDRHYHSSSLSKNEHQYQETTNDGSFVSASVGADLHEDGARSRVAGSGYGRESPVSDIHSEGYRAFPSHDHRGAKGDGIERVIRSSSIEIHDTIHTAGVSGQGHQHLIHRRESLQSQDRNQVSISPLSQSASIQPAAIFPVSHDQAQEHRSTSAPRRHVAAAPLTSQSVGCEHTRKNRSASVPRKPPTSDDRQKPLWINPGARGKLSTAYTQGRDEDEHQKKSSAAFSDSILKVYRRPSPQNSVTVRAIEHKQLYESIVSRRGVESPKALSSTIQPLRTAAPIVSPPQRGASPQRAVIAASPARNSSSTVNNGGIGLSSSVLSSAARSTSPRMIPPHANRAGHQQTSTSKPTAASSETSRVAERSASIVMSDEEEEIVLDLRKDFRPNITKPPPFEEVFGVRRVATPHRALQPPLPITGLQHSHQSREPHSSKRSNASDSDPRTSSRPVTPRPAVATDHRSKTPTSRKVIEVEHVPVIPPFEMYSSFGNATAKGGRPSAWAKAATKIGLFDVSPKKKRHTVTVDGAHHIAGHEQQGTSVVVDPETGLSAIIKYDAYGHRIKLIRDAPVDPEAIEAQRKLDHRLAMPRPIYVRKGEHS